MFFPQFGPMELILILAIVLLVFGVGKLPQALGSIGRGIREFRKGVSGEDVSPPRSDTPTAPPTA
jgi:sec-independent protein translocase protein TatA